MPLRYALIFIALVILGGIGSIVQDIYRTWATFSVPLDQKVNVVVKPVEKFNLILNLALLAVLAVFAAFFVSAGSPMLGASTALIVLVGGAAMIRQYRKTVSRPITNPIDVVPVKVDPAEKIELSVAGIGRTGSFLDKGFSQRMSYWTPESGRRLDPTAQNALLASNKRLYFIFVPMGLSDQTLLGERLQGIELSFGAKYIQAQLDEMLQTMSLEQIYKSHPINFALNLSDVSRIEVKKIGMINSQNISFFDQNGQKLSIFVRNRPDLDKLGAFFQRTGIPSSPVGV